MDDGHPILVERIFSVGEVFRYVHMATDASVLGNANTALQGFVGESKGCMKSHHGRDLSIAFANLLNKAFVLFHAAAGNVSV